MASSQCVSSLVDESSSNVNNSPGWGDKPPSSRQGVVSRTTGELSNVNDPGCCQDPPPPYPISASTSYQNPVAPPSIRNLLPPSDDASHQSNTASKFQNRSHTSPSREESEASSSCPPPDVLREGRGSYRPPPDPRLFLACKANSTSVLVNVGGEVHELSWRIMCRLPSSRLGEIFIYQSRLGEIFVYQSRLGEIFLYLSKLGEIFVYQARLGEIFIYQFGLGEIFLYLSRLGEIFVYLSRLGEIFVYLSRLGEIFVYQFKLGEIFGYLSRLCEIFVYQSSL